MEIVYFVLGVVTVLLVLGVVVIVKVSNSTKGLLERIGNVETNINNVESVIHRRIDDDVRELQTHLKEVLNVIDDTKDVLHHRIDEFGNQTDVGVTDIHQRIDYEVKDILSMVDSRLDKLESKIKGKDLLKG